MKPDDVVIADIGGQALDIFLHGPESAHKNGILKAFTTWSGTEEHLPILLAVAHHNIGQEEDN